MGEGWVEEDVQELGLLLVLVAVAILTYSSLVYFAESQAGTEAGLNCTGWVAGLSHDFIFRLDSWTSLSLYISSKLYSKLFLYISFLFIFRQ